MVLVPVPLICKFAKWRASAPLHDNVRCNVSSSMGELQSWSKVVGKVEGVSSLHT